MGISVSYGSAAATALVCSALWAAACSSTTTSTTTQRTPDGGAAAQAEAGTTDGRSGDGGPPDGSLHDAGGSGDGGPPDGSLRDAGGSGDGGPPDGSLRDAGDNPSTPSACTFVDQAPVLDGLRADLVARGSGLHALDGETAWIYTGLRGPTRIAVARFTVEDGAFEVRVPDGVTHYTGVGVYVDLDGDSRCDADEPMYEMTTGIADTDSVLELTPTNLVPGNCLVNGGVGDLRGPLTCLP